jgi:hypothetical protein
MLLQENECFRYCKKQLNGKGKATLNTVSGGTLVAMMQGKDLIITDENGGKSKVTP